MGRKAQTMAAVFGVLLLVGGCTRTADSAQPTAPDADRYGNMLRQRMSADAMMIHLHKLQDIADANGNTRAIGTPGYDASVDYVANTLRDKGFDVQTPEFWVRLFDAEPGTVTAGPDSFVTRALQYSIGTPPEGVTAPLVAARAGDETPGCTASDYDGLPVRELSCSSIAASARSPTR